MTRFGLFTDLLRATPGLFKESAQSRIEGYSFGWKSVSYQANWSRVKRTKGNVCTIILFCELVWPIAATSQQDKSFVDEMRPITAAQDRAQRAAKSSGLKPCFDAQAGQTSKEREEAAVANLPENYRFWLTEDAFYIITPEEHCAFLLLRSNEERDHFVEEFWTRRASDPESLENDFQEEHYRRIVFANEKFGTGIPGWQTDRGRLYISLGPPDRIESRGEDSQEGYDNQVRHSRATWHYRYIEGLGQNIDFDLIDTTGSGDYHLTKPLEDWAKEIVNLPYHLPYNLGSSHGGVESKGLEQIIIYVGPVRPPKVKYKDLEALVVAQIVRDQIHFSHRIEYAKATHASIMARIVIDIPEDQLSPPARGEKPLATYEIFGRIAKPTGWVVSTFERCGQMDEQNESGEHNPNRETTVALEPGRYQLSLVVKDSDSGKTGVIYTTFEVPKYKELGKH
jgi:GWxTD domain-containing protein